MDPNTNPNHQISPDGGDVDHRRENIIVCFDLNSKQDKAPRWNPVQVLGKPSKG